MAIRRCFLSRIVTHKTARVSFTSFVKLTRAVFPALVGLALAMGRSAPAAAAERLTDREVTALVQQIDDGRGRFVGALDDELKRAVLRSPTGEVDVDRFLGDFDRNIDQLRSRIKAEYAASSEAAIVLRQASAIDRFFHERPAGTRGQSEWTSLVSHLKTLAAVYGTNFPIVEPATVRRLSRRELATSARTAAQSADRFKRMLNDDLKDDASVDKAARESIVDEADQLKKDAEELRSRLDDDNPSTGELDRMLARATTLQQYVAGRKLPTATEAWNGVALQMRQLAAAYEVTW
jgi:hypothetical protein